MLFELKLKLSPFNFGFFFISFANFKYPKTASNTCCQGLVALGLLINIFFFDIQHLIQSGINLFLDQSPPPITFPALAVQTVSALFLFFMYVSKKDLNKISDEALDAL